MQKLRSKIDYSSNAIENSEFSQKNKENLREFRKGLMAEGLSKHRINTCLMGWTRIDHLIDFDISQASKDDLKDVVALVNQNEINDKDYSVWTLNETRKSIRRYYIWLTGEESPEIVDFVRAGVRSSKKPKTDPDELLTKDQVYQVIGEATNLRDETFLTVLWDSGARIGEILNLEWRDIRFKDDMVGLKIREGKTGGRKIYLVESKEVLERWSAYCDEKKDVEPEDPVFTKYRPYSSTEPFQYRNARKQVHSISERAGIPSHIKTNPHAWRKARATHMAGQGMNQPTMNQYFGWARGSDNPVIYIRLAKRDVERSVRRIYDLE